MAANIEVSGDPLNNAIAAVLRMEQADQNLSDVFVYRKAGIARATYERAINDKRTMPMPVFILICQALGVEASDVAAKAFARLEKADKAQAESGR